MTLLSEVRKIKGSNTFVSSSLVWDTVDSNPGLYKSLEKIKRTHAGPGKTMTVTRRLKMAGWVRLGGRNSVTLWGEPDAE